MSWGQGDLAARADDPKSEQVVEQVHTTSTLSAITRVHGTPRVFELREAISYRIKSLEEARKNLDEPAYSINSRRYSITIGERYQCGERGPEGNAQISGPPEELCILDQDFRPRPEVRSASGAWLVARKWLTVNTGSFDSSRDLALLVSLEPLKIAIATRWEGPVVRGRPDADSGAIRNMCRAGAESFPGGLFDSLQLVFEERLDVRVWATVTFDADDNGTLHHCLRHTSVRDLICGDEQAD